MTGLVDVSGRPLATPTPPGPYDGPWRVKLVKANCWRCHREGYTLFAPLLRVPRERDAFGNVRLTGHTTYVAGCTYCGAAIQHKQYWTVA